MPHRHGRPPAGARRRERGAARGVALRSIKRWEKKRGVPVPVSAPRGRPGPRAERRRRDSNPRPPASRRKVPRGRRRPAPSSRDEGAHLSASRAGSAAAPEVSQGDGGCGAGRQGGGRAGRRVLGRCRRAAPRLPPVPFPRARRRHGCQRLQVAGAVAVRLLGGGRRRSRRSRRAAGPGPGAGRARRHPVRLHAPRLHVLRRGRGSCPRVLRGDDRHQEWEEACQAEEDPQEPDTSGHS